MSKYNPFPKPLKGGNQQLIDLIEENSQNNLFDPNNVNITGGTIDGVIIGSNNPVSSNFTDISVTNLSATNLIKVGYFIASKFYKKSDINNHIEIIPKKEKCPF